LPSGSLLQSGQATLCKGNAAIETLLIDERFWDNRKDCKALIVTRVRRTPAAAAAARSQFAKRWSATNGTLMGKGQPLTESAQLLDGVLDRDLLAHVELAELCDCILMNSDDVRQKPP